MQSGLSSLSSGHLAAFLRAVAQSRTRAFLSGIAASALTQSSTAVSLATVALAHARHITLSEGIAIILGANIGTTLTVQLLALNPGQLALFFGLSGLGLLTHRSAARFLGRVFTGVGTIFAGLDLLNWGLAPFGQAPWFTATLAAAGKNRFLALTIATLFTALLHSSGAATALVMTLHTQGAISRETAAVQ